MPQTRRSRKKRHTGLFGFIVLIAVFAGIAFLIASPPTSHSSVQATRSVGSVQGEDAFYGTIKEGPLKAQTTGVVKADTNCKTVEKGLTNCIGIITAADGTELRFNYTHDMSAQACLASGDRVTIIPLNDGTVKVLRE